MIFNLPSTQHAVCRVGFLTPFLNLGGAERWLTSLSRHWRSVKVSSVGFLPKRAEYYSSAVEELSRICPIYSTVRGAGQLLGSDEEVAMRVASECDVLITWDLPHITCIRGGDTPVVDVCHNDSVCKHQVQIAEASWSNANYVVGVSQAALDCYPDEIKKHGQVIYNGIEVDRVTPRKGRKAARHGWGLEDHHKVLLFMGRYAPHKHPEKVVDAIRQLPEEWIGLFVGNGPLMGELFRNLKDALPGRFRKLPVASQVGDFLAAADVFVLPSDYEGHPLALLEAWMAGVPTVCSDFTTIKELEKNHGQLTWQFPRRSSFPDMCQAILTAYDAGRDHEVVHRARSVVWQNYTASKMAYRWEKYLLDIVRQWGVIHSELIATTEVEPTEPGAY